MNSVSMNIINLVRSTATVIAAVASGDFTTCVTVSVNGKMLNLKNDANNLATRMSMLTNEVVEVTKAVGIDGKLGPQVRAPDASGFRE